MKKVIILVLLVIILAGLSVLGYQNFKLSQVSDPVSIPPTGLIVNTPKVNALVASPLTVSGYVDGKDRWTGFEGQVGIVQLLDGNGKVLTFGILTATDENWMQFPTNFSTTLNFSSPTTSVGTLVFKNENASGMAEYEREFRLPIKFTPAAETVKLQAYFSNNNLDPEMTCEKVFPVIRVLPKTQAVAKAALEELLKGPNDEEMLSGYSTSLNAGVKINSLVIDNGVAKVDFNQTLENGVAGSCRVGVIRLQIVETLKQFPSVSSVIISVNGRTEDILQP